MAEEHHTTKLAVEIPPGHKVSVVEPGSAKVEHHARPAAPEAEPGAFSFDVTLVFTVTVVPAT